MGKAKGDTSKKADTKLSVRKAADKPAGRPAKKAKAGKDPNKPKRPPSAFFVFMEEFRETYKKKNPNVNKVSVIGKAGGEKWKSLSDAEKAPYVAKANKLKAEYEKKVAAYNKGESVSTKSSKTDDADEEGSDKSKSEVNDNDDEEGSEDEEEDDD